MPARFGEWGAPLLLAAAVLGSALLEPLPQDPAYHAFADARTILGIPHFWNVVSNLPFLAVGLWGVVALMRRRLALDDGTRLAYGLGFLGVALTGFGSAWYHLEPTNQSLVWDRLPMTLAFMALFAAFVGERTRPAASRYLVGPLLLLGVGTVFYWHFTEERGAGNLLPYLAMQFAPGALIPLLLLVTPARWTRGGDWLGLLAWYVLAKGLENGDRWIYELLGQVGGHPVKHGAAAMGALWIVRMLSLRRLRP